MVVACSGAELAKWTWLRSGIDQPVLDFIPSDRLWDEENSGQLPHYPPEIWWIGGEMRLGWWIDRGRPDLENPPCHYVRQGQGSSGGKIYDPAFTEIWFVENVPQGPRPASYVPIEKAGR